MSHLVKCKYCGQSFDRDVEVYVQIPIGKTGEVFRYGHGKCYLEAKVAKKEKNQYDILDPAHFKTCFWCHKALNIMASDAMPMPQLPGRYIHCECGNQHPADDEESLMIYIMQLYGVEGDYLPPSLRKQITQYHEQQKYTYSGMEKTLRYWHEVEKHIPDKTKGVGIIPYIYEKAKQYYQALYNAQIINADKRIKDYIPKDIEVTIAPPQRQLQKRKLFTFLDEEELNGNE